jgi:hypothetical protein
MEIQDQITYITKLKYIKAGMTKSLFIHEHLYNKKSACGNGMNRLKGRTLDAQKLRPVGQGRGTRRGSKSSL